MNENGPVGHHHRRGGSTDFYMKSSRQMKGGEEGPRAYLNVHGHENGFYDLVPYKSESHTESLITVQILESPFSLSVSI